METKTDLEMKLEDLLKNVEGVGNVKVMLMTESGQGCMVLGEMKLPEC